MSSTIFGVNSYPGVGNINTSATITTPATTYTVDSVKPNSVYDFEVRGDANITGDLTVKGRSIIESLELIEKRLGILIPEPILPDKNLLQKYEELMAVKRHYEELEEQFRLMQVLKT